jgi:hypothetical protein
MDERAICVPHFVADAASVGRQYETSGVLERDDVSGGWFASMAQLLDRLLSADAASVGHEKLPRENERTPADRGRSAGVFGSR